MINKDIEGVEEKADRLAKEKYPDNMGGMEQKGVERYRAGFKLGYKLAEQSIKEEPEVSVLDRKKVMGVLINHFQHTELNSYLQLVADNLMNATNPSPTTEQFLAWLLQPDCPYAIVLDNGVLKFKTEGEDLDFEQVMKEFNNR